MRYEIWRHDRTSWVSTDMSFGWKWMADLWAWEHEKRGWFKYVVVPEGQTPSQRGG